MERLAAVTHLCNGTDIDNLWLFVFGLRQDSVSNIGRSRYIGLARGSWTVVGLRRNHASDVQNDVGTRYAFEDVFVFG